MPDSSKYLDPKHPDWPVCYRCKRARHPEHWPVRADGTRRKICLICYAMIPRKKEIPLSELKYYSSRWAKYGDKTSQNIRRRSVIESVMQDLYPTGEEEKPEPQENKEESKEELSALDILNLARKK